MASYTKDPDAHLDYTIDWTAWLPDGDTIATAQILPVEGLTISNVAHNDTAVTYWASGGTVGHTYGITCRITTAHNPARVEDRTDTMRIRQR